MIATKSLMNQIVWAELQLTLWSFFVMLIKWNPASHAKNISHAYDWTEHVNNFLFDRS